VDNFRIVFWSTKFILQVLFDLLIK